MWNTATRLDVTYISTSSLTGFHIMGHSGFMPSNLLRTKGSIAVGGGDGTAIIIAPSADGQIPESTATAAGGVVWKAATAYVEGTWTPTVTFVTPGDLNVAYTTRYGDYTKKGREVTVNGNILTSTFTFTTASGNFQITGLPFTSANTSGLVATGSLVFQGFTITGYTQCTPRIDANTSAIIFIISSSALTASSVTQGNAPTGGTLLLQFTITYHV